MTLTQFFPNKLMQCFLMKYVGSDEQNISFLFIHFFYYSFKPLQNT